MIIKRQLGSAVFTPCHDIHKSYSLDALLSTLAGMARADLIIGF